MGRMKELGFLIFLFIAVLFVQNASAVSILFDFDGDNLPWLGGAAVIENYMEDIGGSAITVTGGRVGNGIISGPLHNYHGDHYIQSEFGCGRNWFSFSFDELAITAVSFDWGVRAGTFRAYADDAEEPFFSSRGWNLRACGNSGTISFDSPVHTLKFTGPGFWGEVEIDNLAVTYIPEPATISLLGICGAMLILTRRRRPV